MKIILKISKIQLQQCGMILKGSLRALFLLVFVLTAFQLTAQEEEETKKKEKPVRAMFESTWLIDNQSVVVPVKGTFQMDILHRFGTVKNGYDDVLGLFAPSNIKLGFGYTPIDNLMLGFGLTKDNMLWDFNAKYALFQQTRSGSFPLSITYFGNAAVDTRPDDNFVNSTDRWSYFHQIIIARKLTDKLSIQVAPSLSHHNAVEGYVNQDKEIESKMKNDHIAVALSGRFKITDQMSIIGNYDQPITEHTFPNPNPNVSFGLEISTSSHAFQVFLGNYKGIVPQRNNAFNANNYEDGEFLIGFNITRLWN